MLRVTESRPIAALSRSAARLTGRADGKIAACNFLASL
jgi:hypothetical protein